MISRLCVYSYFWLVNAVESYDCLPASLTLERQHTQLEVLQGLAERQPASAAGITLTAAA
jgi:hypothetical protein